MKRAMVIAVVLGMSAAAYAADAPSWARVYYDAPAAMERDVLLTGMDVASGGEGYVDVVASAGELGRLQDLGYRIEIIAENAFENILALPPDMGLYHTYAEMLTELQQRESAYPNICKLYDVGDTWENREMWEKMEPFNRVENITTPTLILCGEKDWNVPVINSEQLYMALKRLGRTTELVVYPGEFHGIRTPSYIKDKYTRYLDWFAKYVKGRGTETEE